MPSFIETPRFPDAVAFWVRGGPEYNTGIAQLYSGLEQRNVNWDQARWKGDLGAALRIPANIEATIAYFRAMKGRAYGFRIKDFMDYQATQALSSSGTRGYLGTGAVGTPSTGQYQLYKAYTAGTLTDLRKIRKPVSGTVTAYANGVAIPGATVDTANGIVTVPPLLTRGVIAVTKANPGLMSFNVAHNFTTGDQIALTSIGGMTQLNGTVVTITTTGNTQQATIGVNTSAYGTYTSGGVATKNYQPSTAMTWTGEFDVPVRMDNDGMQGGMTEGGLYQWDNLSLIELLSD